MRGFLDNRYLSHWADISQASPQFPIETHERDHKRDHSARELLLRTARRRHSALEVELVIERENVKVRRKPAKK